MTVDEAVALPDPPDCRKPGTRAGRISKASNARCYCSRHTAITRAQQRVRDRRRRGDRRSRPNQLGASWVIGRNALDAAPLLERLTAAGAYFPNTGMRDLPESFPFPEHAGLIRRTYNRGWLTLHEADLLCIRVLGVHPFHVFGEAWDRLETGEPL